MCLFINSLTERGLFMDRKIQLAWSKWPKERQELFIEMYQWGEAEDILREFGWSKFRSVHEFARKIPVRRLKKRSNGCIGNLLKPDLESFYWAGFIAADGCIQKDNQLMVAISVSDIDHITKLAEYLNTSVKTYQTSSGFTENYEYARVNILDPEHIEVFKQKFDFGIRKTYNPPDFARYRHFSKSQLTAFLLGFVDGDGYITKYCTLRIQNHPSWEDFLTKILQKIEIPFNKTIDTQTKTGRKYVTHKLQVQNVIELYAFAVRNNLPILARKWDKIKERQIMKEGKNKNNENE